jgi:hypothetical protein
MVGQMPGAEACEHAEGEVEGADDKLCRKAHGAGGNAEVGDQPESAGSEGWGDSCDQDFDVWLGEAVEEEVSDDQVVFFSFVSVRRGEVQGVGLVGLQARRDVGADCFAAAAEKFEHGGTGVDGVGLEVWVLCEQTGEEATVSVAEDEGPLLVEEVGEIVEAAALESLTEGEVFEPAIGPGDGVEVGLGEFHGLAGMISGVWSAVVLAHDAHISETRYGDLDLLLVREEGRVRGRVG